MAREFHKRRPGDGEGESRRALAAAAELAATQRGAISREQLRVCGLSDDRIDFWIATKRLHPRHRGVYALGHRRLTRKGRYVAAVLFAGDGAVLSHYAAADLWELRASRELRIDVTAPSNRRGDRTVVIHGGALEQGEITTHEGIPVTTPLRTLLDLAAVVPRAELERAIRQAVYQRLTTTALLAEAVNDRRGQRGTKRLRTALTHLGEAPGVTRSQLEDQFLRFLRRHRLPLPELNVELEIGGRKIEADCVWRDRRLIVELDGRDAHDSTPAFESDRARDLALTALGWRTGRVTSRRLRHDGPALAGELRALTRRDPPSPSTRRRT